MNEIKIFENERFGQIRTVIIDGEPWFVGKDVAKILGYSETNAMTKRLDPQDFISDKLAGMNMKSTLVNESGLYDAIFGSKLPEARPFKRWVTADVLPTLRKTGSYKMPKKGQSQDERMQTMKMNAKSRMAQTYLKLANVDTLSKEYKNILVSKAAEVLADEQLIPLPKSKQKTYSATDIGKILGISNQMVGRLTNKHNLKTEEYGEFYRDKSRYSNRECDNFRYYENVIPVLERIVNQH